MMTISPLTAGTKTNWMWHALGREGQRESWHFICYKYCLLVIHQIVSRSGSKGEGYCSDLSSMSWWVESTSRSNLGGQRFLQVATPEVGRSLFIIRTKGPVQLRKRLWGRQAKKHPWGKVVCSKFITDSKHFKGDLEEEVRLAVLTQIQGKAGPRSALDLPCCSSLEPLQTLGYTPDGNGAIPTLQGKSSTPAGEESLTTVLPQVQWNILLPWALHLSQPTRALKPVSWAPLEGDFMPKEDLSVEWPEDSSLHYSKAF